MNRKNFLKNSALAGFTITSLTTVSCNTSAPKEKAVDKNTAPSASPESFELNELPSMNFSRR